MNKALLFISETRDELKKVTWPDKQKVVSLSQTVIVVSLVIGLYLGSLDFIFNEIIQFVLKSSTGN